MTKPATLTTDEYVAWDGYVSRAASATLQSWFRWKQGIPVDRPTVIAEATAIADLLILERRKR